jgi:ABC-type multidrug transport system fused ATPase/permease subunit
MEFIKSLFRLFSPQQKRSYTYLQILFLFNATMQVAGIASLAPFITLISRPEMISTNKFIHSIYVAVGSENNNSFFATFAIAIMVLIATSNFVAGFSTWKLYRFSIDIGAELQKRIYSNYIRNDYVFFSTHNSSALIAIVTSEINRFVYMVLQPFLYLTSQALIAFIVVIGLFYVDYFLASLSVLMVGGIYVFIFKLLRTRLAKHGERIAVINKEKIKLLAESIGGIKEVKLLGTESWYQDQIDEKNKQGLQSGAFISLTGDLPRYIVETIVFLAILGLALYLMREYGNSGKVISILSLYAMAGYKLLPAVQVIFKSISTLKATAGVVELLLKEVENSTPQDLDHTNASKITISEPEILLKDVSYRYPGANNNALNNVSLTIKPNTMVAFVGASGAGKSTAVDIILGMLYPDQGQLIVGGNNITKANVRGWQNYIGYVPQNIFLIDDTVANNIAFGIPKEQIDMTRIITSAKMANIHHYIDSLPQQYNTNVGERGAQLSGGQKQRIGIARALYRDTNVLIMDEATSALDSITESQIMSEIFSLAKARTIIVIAHRLSTVINADNIVFFENGTVSDQGTFHDLRKRNKNFDLQVKHSLENTKDHTLNN